MTLGPPWPPPPFGSDEWIARFATLPLLHQPGAEWRYNTGAQVLGILLERASGQPLETFLRARLFEPLGMVDTSFSVPAGKQARFTTAYLPGPRHGRAPRLGPARGRLVERAAGDGERGGDVGVDARRPVGLRVHDAGGRSARGTAAVVAGRGRRHDARSPDGVQRASGRSSSAITAGGGTAWPRRVLVTGAPPRPWGFGWNGGTGTRGDRPRARPDRDHAVDAGHDLARAPAHFVDFWEAAYAAMAG